MRIENIRIRNFKGLKNIELKTDTTATLIVGPNAVGKSTILESIRVNKSFLFPNIQNEANVVLNSMKAISPDQQNIITSSLLNENEKKLEITIEFAIEDSEISSVESTFKNKFIIRHLQNTNRFPIFREPFSEAQYLSSDAGKSTMEVGRVEIDSYIKELKINKKVSSSLSIENGLIRGNYLLDQEFLTIVCESKGYALTYFNYFPADRSLPFGDQPIQIGFGNATQQQQSYIANPQSKYQLIKQFIINMYLSSVESKEHIEKTFSSIFNSLLPGKSLGGVEISTSGNISITINDNIKGTQYDIDNMSSGEKNLLLTLLFMDITTCDNGIILFDEPELHLNPAVQKKIINFLVDIICKNGRQILLCTHSPEMFATAFDRPDCKIFHLISSNDISPIYKQDKSEVFNVLQRLGSNSTDLLSTKGVIYLEGPHDTELLDIAISSLLSGFTAKHLGGRKEIEKNIKTLQAEDQKNKLDSHQYFLFDLDNKPTGLNSTKKVKLVQWDRYCLENYLLESDSIFEVIKANSSLTEELTRGSLLNNIKEIAFKQINKVASKDVISSYLNNDRYIKITEILSETPEATVNNLFNILSTVNSATSKLTPSTHRNEILQKINDKISETSDDWQAKWVVHCDGKAVITELHRNYKVMLSMLDFKKKILEISRERNNENWRLIDAKLKELVNPQ